MIRALQDLERVLGETKWEKLGLVYSANNFRSDWRWSSALTPTPFVRMCGVTRVFAGFRDQLGVSRIGYVDLDETCTRIARISEKPVLDVGTPGCFDDNGVILGDVLRIGDRVYMFYVGFQLVKNVKFLAFSGLAVSVDDGDTFTRLTQTPFLDRRQDEIYIGAIHSVLPEDHQIRIWYAAGNGWQRIDGKDFPRYEIRQANIKNIETSLSNGVSVLQPEGCEYRIGRPRVYKMGHFYCMFYTAGTTNGSYFPGVCLSVDGETWHRSTCTPCPPLSPNGWDSLHLCYPTLLKKENSVFMFYNGNNMGEDGFGVARSSDLELWNLLS